MKQVVFRSGKAITVEVPIPNVKPGFLQVEVKASCISPGTESTSLKSSAKTIWQKALENPDKVKATLERMKIDGIFSVFKKINAQHEHESACGYSAAGIVREIGEGITSFTLGMRVAIAGVGFANHAEYANVPVNLAVEIPDGVSFEDASTCAIGSIALHGIRRAEVSIGDFVVVVGCGAIGLITVQMLKASGCRVIGIDLDSERLEKAATMGAEYVFNPTTDDVIRKVMHVTGGFGADIAILTLDSSSSEPFHQAFSFTRKRGRVVLVGIADMRFEREDIYKKEIDFRISASYGPGRYDDQYELKGMDYPYSYVRWTERRNLEAYLHMVEKDTVRLEGIVSKSYKVDQPDKAYKAFQAEDRPLLILFSYSSNDKHNPVSSVSVSAKWKQLQGDSVKIGLIGTGAFMQGMHIPNLNKLLDQYTVKAVCDQNPILSRQAIRSLKNAEIANSSDINVLLKSNVDLVIIGTRHNSHAEIAIQALLEGKAVFVEKPMCITREEFDKLKEALNNSEAPYFVGYNRRYAPPVNMIREYTSKRVNPLIVHYTMNAGFIPYDSWVHTEEGGGRIVGEACHIFDLFRSLVNSPVETISIDTIKPRTASISSSDNVLVTLKYEDGSICSLLYTSLGSKLASKERMEVFCDEQLFILDDYVSLNGFGAKCSWQAKKPDKGHLNELIFLREQIQKGIRYPIPWEELEETWLISRMVADELNR